MTQLRYVTQNANTAVWLMCHLGIYCKDAPLPTTVVYGVTMLSPG